MFCFVLSWTWQSVSRRAPKARGIAAYVICLPPTPQLWLPQEEALVGAVAISLVRDVPSISMFLPHPAMVLRDPGSRERWKVLAWRKDRGRKWASEEEKKCRIWELERWLGQDSACLTSMRT